MFRPLKDLVVVKIEQPTITSILILPPGHELKEYKFGHVKYIGPKVRYSKVGDTILLNQDNGQRMVLNGEELMIVHERDVEGVYSDGN